MSGQAAGRQDARATLLGWAMSIAFAALFVVIVTVPRTPIDERDLLHALHSTLGLTVMVLVIWRFIHARKQGPLLPPPGMPASAFGFSRMILGALFATFAVTSVIGFAYAWGSGQHVVLFGLTLPQIIPESAAIRIAAGYFHSVLGFFYMGVIGLWLLVGVIHHLRYRSGLLRLFPGARV